jgi:hypothetical protein
MLRACSAYAGESSALERLRGTQDCVAGIRAQRYAAEVIDA